MMYDLEPCNHLVWCAFIFVILSIILHFLRYI